MPRQPDAPAEPRAFSFIRLNDRECKPRRRGITEIRGPYYTPLGRHALDDILETAGSHVDSLKFAGGAFALMPRRVLVDFINRCHQANVLVSTGGFIEHVLARDPAAIDRYIGECRDCGFDIVEISSGFITMPADDWLRLIEQVQKAGLKAKPEVGIQFGAGGATSASELEAAGVRDVQWPIQLARRFLGAGAYMIMIESEGITESVATWRTDAPARIIDALGLEHVMFEAADPAVFGWYVQNYGPDVNLFVDHSQILQLECLRAGLWGTAGVWGRVVTYSPDAAE